MARYLKDNPRLSVKFFDSATNKQLFEIHNRTWMDVGELFSDNNVDLLIKQYLPENKLPSSIIVLASAEYNLT